MTIKDKIILGIDPGTNLMGYGILKITDNKPQMVTMGVIDLRKFPDAYLKLGHIFDRVTGIIDGYLPDEMAIEAPFFGKNVQSMLKLGRAQGVAMVAALNREIPISEYEPRKIKMAITGNGAASKEQVAMMLQRTLGIDEAQMPALLDATDALAAALCHFYERNKPFQGKGTKSWKTFIAQHPDRVKKTTRQLDKKKTKITINTSYPAPSSDLKIT